MFYKSDTIQHFLNSEDSIDIKPKKTLPFDPENFITQLMHYNETENYQSFIETIKNFVDNELYIPSSYEPGYIGSNFLDLLHSSPNPQIYFSIFPFLLKWTCVQSVENDIFANDFFFKILMEHIFTFELDQRFDPLPNYHLYFYYILMNLLYDSHDMREIFINACIETDLIKRLCDIYSNEVTYEAPYEIIHLREAITKIFDYSLIDLKDFQSHSYNNYSLRRFFEVFHPCLNYNCHYTQDYEFHFLKSLISSKIEHLNAFLQSFNFVEFFSSLPQDIEEDVSTQIVKIFDILISIFDHFEIFDSELQLNIRDRIISKIHLPSIIAYYEKSRSCKEECKYIKILTSLLKIDKDPLLIYFSSHPKGITKMINSIIEGNYESRILALELFEYIFSMKSLAFNFIADEYSSSEQSFFNVLISLFDSEDQTIYLKIVKVIGNILDMCNKDDDIFELIYGKILDLEIIQRLEEIKNQEETSEEVIQHIDLIFEFLPELNEKHDALTFAIACKEKNALDENESSETDEPNNLFNIFEEDYSYDSDDDYQPDYLDERRIM